MKDEQISIDAPSLPIRVERLLWERELREQRKSSRAFHSKEVIDNHRGVVFENDPCFRKGDNSGVAFVEQYLEEAATARALVKGFERQDGRPFRQRLLVGVNVPDEIGQKALTKASVERGLSQEDRLATTRSFQSQFTAYKKANQMFADIVSTHCEEGEVVWCHDYHLMYLLECLKKYNTKMKVGWFLHISFPSEIHRTPSSRSELLRSILAADLSDSFKEIGREVRSVYCKKNCRSKCGLQCQKRVHAFPLSLSSLLRMYRIASHSPYDPLHLVPKMLNDSSPSVLDSRADASRAKNLNITLTRSRFESWMNHLIARTKALCKNCLKDAVISTRMSQKDIPGLELPSTEVEIQPARPCTQVVSNEIYAMTKYAKPAKWLWLARCEI
ncbi:hypothetical protein REPUB_Repub04eG0049300 [Reevesia pubescens]